MNAIQPEYLEGPSVASMAVGEIAYTTPWGMWVDAERRCWLHPGYPAQHFPSGTVSMRIERRDDGWHVWPPKGETWTPRNQSGYAGADSVTEWVPVVALHGLRTVAGVLR